MSKDKPLINKIALNTSLIALNLEDWFPKAPIINFDLKQFLFKELLLKEKDFRAYLLAYNWDQFRDKIVLIGCSTDAIIPQWAYMLVTKYLNDIALDIFNGSKENYLIVHYTKTIENIDSNDYLNKKVMVRGCGKKEVPTAVYTIISKKLLPVVSSLMYGEACSTVPIYKKK